MLTPAIVREIPKKRQRPEDAIQAAVVEHLRFRHVPGLVWHSTPNERKANGREGARLKRMGLRPGAPDLVFILPPIGTYAGLELKTKAGRQSAAQREFQYEAAKAGALYAVAHGVDEAITILRGWGAIL